MLAALLFGACASAGPRAETEVPGPDPAVCVAEVRELHAFFETWFRGALPDDEEAFARFERALAPEFEIALSTGELLTREEILERVRAGHGRGQVAIRVERPVAHPLSDGEVAVCYEEWHVAPNGVSRGRSCRALLRPSDDAPGGVEWVRVDEVWLN